MLSYVTEMFVAGLIQGEMGLVHYLIMGAAIAAGLILVVCAAVILWQICKIDLRRHDRRPRSTVVPNAPPPSRSSVLNNHGDVFDPDPGIMLLPKEDEGGSLQLADSAC